jgi:threonine dehydratase
MTIPSLEDIRQAHERIRPFIHATPVFTSHALDGMSGAALFFKCENLQKVGAFKARGATNAVWCMEETQARRGVVTHSSGNHAAALSWAASIRGIPAHIVMPRNAPAIKKRAVAAYGGLITECEPTLADREATAARITEQTGAVMVHPFDNYCIIAAQATAAVELHQESGPLDWLLVPVGGGGLAAGSALAMHYLETGTRVVACEPAMADDAQRSFRSGTLQPMKDPRTIADGLRTQLSEKTFAIIRAYVHDVVTVSEEEIVAAMRTVWERMKLVIEPSSAVPVAVALSGRIPIAGQRVGIILSGGNVDLEHLPF